MWIQNTSGYYQYKVNYSDGTNSDWRTDVEWSGGVQKAVDLSLGKRVNSVETRAILAGLQFFAFAVGDPAMGGIGTTLLTNKLVLTFPSSNGFDCFEPGDVVQGAEKSQNQDLRSGQNI